MKRDFQIRGELITLDALLKAVGAADSGAQAKAMIADILVLLYSETELRKTLKLRRRDTLQTCYVLILLKADPSL